MQVFHYLSFFRPFALMLFLMCEVVFDDLAQISKRLSWNQFSRKRVIQRRQYFLLNLAKSNIVICLSSREFLCRKICRKIDGHRARFARLLTCHLLAKFRQEIIGREA